MSSLKKIPVNIVEALTHYPAAKVRCKTCSKISRFTSVSLSLEVRDDNSRATEEVVESPYNEVHAVSGESTAGLLTVTLRLAGKPCIGQLDMGITHTILTTDLVQSTRTTDQVLCRYILVVQLKPLAWQMLPLPLGTVLTMLLLCRTQRQSENVARPGHISTRSPCVRKYH